MLNNALQVALAAAEEYALINAAYAALDKPWRVLAPASEARVIYRDFDPCRAVQVIATVEWPAVVGSVPVTLTYHIKDGDRAVLGGAR